MLPKFKKLRGRMYENQVTQEDIAKLLGRSEAYVSMRMTAKQPFDIDEVYKICEYLDVPECEIHIFFPRGGIEQKKAG